MASRKSVFEMLGCPLRDVRGDWSGLSPDGNRVAVTVWEDEIEREAELWTFGKIPCAKLGVWKDRRGNKRRIQHFEHALARTNGLMEIVLVTARNQTDEPRKVIRAVHMADRYAELKSEDFDRTTGKFLLYLHKRS